MLGGTYSKCIFFAQKQLADSQSAVKSMEKSLKGRPGDAPVSEDDKDREIKLLTSEVHLAQVYIVYIHLVYNVYIANTYDF